MHVGSRAEVLYVNKLGVSAETNVDVTDSELGSCEDSDENYSDLPQSNRKTKSVPEMERKQSEEEASCCAGTP